jgi:pimeloyl-ACP methyl ester carboxylesterase
LIDAEETFSNTWPYAARFFDGSGFRQHYIDERGTGDETFVCVHGEPTWGYLYRQFVPRLSRLGRVVIPDHMGFGKSETPQDRDYSIEEHVDNLERLLIHLDVTGATLIVQDWGGPIGGSFAYRHPDRVKRICVCNSVIPGGSVPEGIRTVADHDWFRWVHSPAFEPTVSNLGSSILSVMKRIGFERTRHIDEEWVRAYASAFPTAESCRGALQFPRNIANPATAAFLQKLLEENDADAVRAIPAICIHGEADRAIPTEFAVANFRSLWPDSPVVTLPGVGHFLQEDAPEAVCAMIALFAQT